MEQLKASLEQMLGPTFFLHPVPKNTYAEVTTEEKILIYDRRQSPLLPGRGIEIQRKGDAPEKLTLEELAQLPSELQEEDARYIGSVSRSENNRLAVVIHRKLRQRNGSGEIVFLKEFNVNQSNVARMLPQMLRFLEGETHCQNK